MELGSELAKLENPGCQIPYLTNMNRKRGSKSLMFQISSNETAPPINTIICPSPDLAPAGFETCGNHILDFRTQWDLVFAGCTPKLPGGPCACPMR